MIHYAPNTNSKLPSVHLTISTMQRQTLFDLTNKTFEEAMSVMWEGDETMRKALPWNVLTPSCLAFPGVCSSVAALLRRLAEAVDAEAQTAARRVAGAPQSK